MIYLNLFIGKLSDFCKTCVKLRLIFNQKKVHESRLPHTFYTKKDVT